MKLARPREARPIHVLTLTPFYPSDRDEIEGSFVAEPLAGISEFNISSTVISAKPGAFGTFKDREQGPTAIRIRHPQLSGKSAYASWGLLLYLRLARLVRHLHRARHIDLIHAHAALPCGLTAALISRKLKIPFVVTNHGLDVFSTRREHGLLRWWVDRCSRFVFRKAAMNICVSEAVRRNLIDVMGSLARTTVIYNGVDTSLFTPPENYDDSSSIILSVGRLVPDKGHELVLRALAQLAPGFPDLRYQMIDGGPERSRLPALSRELGIDERVEFIDRQSRVVMPSSRSAWRMSS